MKKRFFAAFIFILICISLLASCNTAKTTDVCKHNWERTENLNEYTAMDKCSICEATRKYIDSCNIPISDYEAGLKMIRYNWDGYGISYKEIYTCDLGYAIIDCLSKLQETGEVIPKISEDVVNEFAGKLPTERGTVWLECGNMGLFRLNPEMTDICKVQTHLGEGKTLLMTETLKELLRQAWDYHPNDYWSGAYKDGVVSLQQVYKADSAIEWVEIKRIHIENKHHSKNNKIMLSIKSKENKTVTAVLYSYQSSDNFGSCESKEITLTKNGNATAEFTFGGFYNTSYSVSITIDNTRINLTIDSNDNN